MVKEPCNLIVSKNFLRYEVCTGKQRTTLTFTFGYLQQKVMTKFFDSQKTPFLDPFWALFTDFKVDRNFSWKICFYHFFLFLDLYSCAEFQKKETNRFQEKLVTDVKTDWHTDARTSINSWDLWYNKSKNRLRYMDKNLRVICFSEFQVKTARNDCYLRIRKHLVINICCVLIK